MSPERDPGRGRGGGMAVAAEVRVGPDPGLRATIGAHGVWQIAVTWPPWMAIAHGPRAPSSSAFHSSSPQPPGLAPGGASIFLLSGRRSVAADSWEIVPGTR
jgi:hypothetical protein